MTEIFPYDKLCLEVENMKKFLQNLKADKKFRNTVISVASVVVALAIILSSVLFITNRNKNKVEIGNKSESTSDSRAVVAEPESESATIAQSNEESTSQLDEQNSEPVSQSGNVQTEKPNGNVSQAQKPVNNTTTTTKQHSGNTVTTTKTNSGNGGSAVNTCNHNWKLISYTNGCYVYHCSKCDDYKTDEREMNPNDFMGNKSEYMEFLSLLNKARRAEGLNELQYCPDSRVQNIADIRAKELNVSFSHTRPNGTAVGALFNEYVENTDGLYNGCGGEACHSGNETPEGAFNSLMNSPKHRKILMCEDSTHLVVARCNRCWEVLPLDKATYVG